MPSTERSDISSSRHYRCGNRCDRNGRGDDYYYYEYEYGPNPLALYYLNRPYGGYYGYPGYGYPGLGYPGLGAGYGRYGLGLRGYGTW